MKCKNYGIINELIKVERGGKLAFSLVPLSKTKNNKMPKFCLVYFSPKLLSTIKGYVEKEKLNIIDYAKFECCEPEIRGFIKQINGKTRQYYKVQLAVAENFGGDTEDMVELFSTISNLMYYDKIDKLKVNWPDEYNGI